MSVRPLELGFRENRAWHLDAFETGPVWRREDWERRDGLGPGPFWQQQEFFFRQSDCLTNVDGQRSSHRRVGNGADIANRLNGATNWLEIAQVSRRRFCAGAVGQIGAHASYALGSFGAIRAVRGDCPGRERWYRRGICSGA